VGTKPSTHRRRGRAAATVCSAAPPLEIYDLTRKVTWLRVAALVINLLLVNYLV